MLNIKHMAHRSADFVAVAIVVLSFSHVPLRAQVITDGTVGPATALAGPDFAIGADLGTLTGGNLFHSFESFSIATGGSATFSGPGSVNNIISRVTGGAVSDIDGTIRSTIPGADVFLINPSGIVFGPNASLEVQGSFAASTANEVIFPDGGLFSASDPGASVLSVAPPEAFGFLTSNPASLLVDRSDFTVPAGASLSLVGGELTIQGEAGDGDWATIQTQGGDLLLVSTAQPLSVPLDGGPALTPAETSGSVHIFGTSIDVSGAPSGDVRIIGGDVVFEKSSLLSENTGMDAGGGFFATAQTFSMLEDPVTFDPADAPFVTNRGNPRELPTKIEIINRGDGAGGGVEIRAEEIAILGAIRVEIENHLSGPGGDMILEAGNIEIRQAVVGAATLGDGDGGGIIVTADRLIMDGDEDGIRSFSAFVTDTRGSGGAGGILIEAGQIELRDGGRIGSFVTGGTGPGGDVTVIADSILMVGEDAFRTGIDSNTEGDGPAGTLTVVAGSIVMDGLVGLETSVLPGAPGRVQIAVASFDDMDKNGDAGAINIVADSLQLFGYTEISASTFTGGAGGPIIIDSGLVELRDGARIVAVSFFGTGAAGEISIEADTLILGASANPRGASFIATVSIGPPALVAAGPISITAGSVELLPGSAISALTIRPSRGGDITIEADIISLTGGNQQISPAQFFQEPQPGFTSISSSATNGGTAGNITLNAPLISLDNAALVTTITAGSGSGGTITVNAEAFSVTDGARLDAGTLDSGAGGDIIANATESVFLSGDESGLFVESASTEPDAGLAGSIFVSAPELRIEDGASISTNSALADGGNITIDAGQLVYVASSSITTSVGDGLGGGGNITIDPVFVVLNNAVIEANAFGGPGGNITIVAENFLASPGSIIQASSAQSIDGTVTIDAPETDLSGAVTELSEELLDAAERLAVQCNARGGRTLATFIGRGRSGLPQQPGDPVVALYAAPGAAELGGKRVAMLPGRLEITCEG